MLVFSKGDPAQASADIGVPEDMEALDSTDNARLLKELLGSDYPDE